MPTIDIETVIVAPIEICFDCARDTNLHRESAASTGERVVGGRVGLLDMGDVVTFEAVHFGIKQILTSKIVAFDRPNRFVDEVQKSAFARMRHVHEFRSANGTTIMRDVLEFTSPLGILGRIADSLFLTNYMRRFLQRRNAILKSYAERASGPPPEAIAG